MKFKLNKLERFVLRYYFALMLIYFLIMTISLVACNLFEDLSLIFLLLLIPTILVYGIFVVGTPAKKAKELTKLANFALDMNGTLDACNQMIEVTSPKSTKFFSNCCICRISCLINIGDFDRAENEIRLFWQCLNLKKVVASDLALTHILMANIALEKGNIQLFNEEMRIVNEYSSNSELVGIFKRLYNYNVMDINLFAEAYFANADSNAQEFETRVFTHLNIDETTGKPRKNSPSPMAYFSAFTKLFKFYKNQNDTEKATYYAQQMLGIGNYQLIDYRKAKEYLENGNRSN